MLGVQVTAPIFHGRTCEAEQSGIKATRRISQEGIGELRQVTQGNGVGWARVQATSQGGHEVKVLTSTSVLPPLRTNEAPRGPPIGLNAQCPAGMKPAVTRQPTEALTPKVAKAWKNFGTPTHPTVAPSPQEGGRHPNSRLERKPMQLQGNTVLFTEGKLARTAER